MNILVTGANGQLGQCLRDLEENNGKNKWFWTDVCEIEGRKCDYLDITDAESVKKYFADNEISVCVNCAAYTNVDKAETDKEMADRLNADAPKNLAEACKEFDAKLIHISTDYVFNGTSFFPITEDRLTMPLSVYGKTKLKGEQNVIDSGCKYIIFRTAWLYSEYGNNFVKTMLKLFETKDEISVVYDQIGTPTYARNLAKAVVNALGTWTSFEWNNVYNYTDEGVASWYDFANCIYDVWSENSRGMCKINAVTTRQFYNGKPHAPRPFYSVLNKEKVKKNARANVFNWTDGVVSCVKNIMSKK